MSETKLHLNSNNLSKNFPEFLVFGIISFILLKDAFIRSNFELHLPICSFFANRTHYLGIASATLYQIYTIKITNSAESVFHHLHHNLGLHLFPKIIFNLVSDFGTPLDLAHH